MRPRFATVLVGLVVLLAGPAAMAGLAGDLNAPDSPAVGSAEVMATDAPSCEYPLELTDATGETVTIEEEPETVALTAQTPAQQIWAMGAEDRVIGMPHAHTEYLPGSQERTNTLDGMTLRTETIVDLDPDLVLASNGTFDEDISTLRNLDQTVYQYRLDTTLEDVQQTVGLTGALLGECGAAESVADEMGQTITAVESTLSDVDAPSVFYDMGAFEGAVFTPGEATVEHDVIETAGGENIAGPHGTSYYQLNPEIIAAEDPEWIVIGVGQEPADISAIQDSTAVTEDQIIHVDSNLISQHGPRNVDILVQIAETLHPDAMEDFAVGENGEADDGNGAADDGDADGVDDADDTDGVDGDVDDGDTADDPTDADDDGVGFTAVATVLAVTGLAFVAYRRGT